MWRRVPSVPLLCYGPVEERKLFNEGYYLKGNTVTTNKTIVSSYFHIQIWSEITYKWFVGACTVILWFIFNPNCFRASKFFHLVKPNWCQLFSLKHDALQKRKCMNMSHCTLSVYRFFVHFLSLPFFISKFQHYIVSHDFFRETATFISRLSSFDKFYFL